ncbi:MAG TPA: hybrid sensor histidine kinase/response regulator [Vineibacter sp.]|nr:hybrid sensor histidine kinase/response regulator [Vineibacter sp.]
MVHTPEASQPPSEEVEQAILAEQVRVIYVEGQRLILTGIAAALILVWVLWGHVAAEVLLGWLGTFLVYSLARAAMARAYRRRTPDSTDHRAWMNRAQCALAVGGSLWGIACVLFYVPDRIEYQLFLVTMLLGAVVSGLVTLAVYPPAYLIFVTPFVVAAIVRYGMENDPLHWGIALAATAVLFLFSNFARYIRNSFVESLRLRMELAARNRELAERNREAERANLAKSRFLAAASHDLRQPLHALNLFVGQLRGDGDPAERGRLVARIDAAVADMNELFNALLDISKLDAGVQTPTIADFAVAQLLRRIETSFAVVAREKGLRLRVVSCDALVRSDAILLERILLNLVSNAVRYTSRGGVVVGCRRRDHVLRIEVWDSGVGIPEARQRDIFGEFVQLASPEGDRRAGLGLGLSIVDRLCRLLDHRLQLTSRPGEGSRFSVTVPLTTERPRAQSAADPPPAIADPVRGKLVVVIDDDALVLEGMRGLLQGWGCRVVTADTGNAALAALAHGKVRPDLVISDYHLAAGQTGSEALDQLRSALQTPIPALLISGDTSPERLQQARAGGLLLLHKPVNPMALRAVVNRLLQASDAPARVHEAANP